MNTFTENSLMVVSLLLTIIVPSVALVCLERRKRRKTLLATLENTASSNGLDLSRINYLDGKVIAWDQSKKMLLFTYIMNDRPTMIDLNPISRCYVVRKKNGRDTTSILLQIEDANKRVRHSIPFYEQFTDREGNVEKFDVYSREWAHLINSNLSAGTQPSDLPE